MLALLAALVAAVVVDVSTGECDHRDYRRAATLLIAQVLPAFISDLYEVGFVGATVALAIRNVLDPLGYKYWLRITGQLRRVAPASPRRK